MDTHAYADGVITCVRKATIGSLVPLSASLRVDKAWETYLDGLSVVLVCPASVVAQIGSNVKDVVSLRLIEASACTRSAQRLARVQLADDKNIPALSASSAASSSAFFSTRSANLNISFARSAAVTLVPQVVLNACSAAATAASTSALLAIAALVMKLPSAASCMSESTEVLLRAQAHQDCGG